MGDIWRDVRHVVRARVRVKGGGEREGESFGLINEMRVLRMPGRGT
jgi:hypothetical protein